jgi:hypothetical protein
MNLVVAATRAVLAKLQTRLIISAVFLACVRALAALVTGQGNRNAVSLFGSHDRIPLYAIAISGNQSPGAAGC